MPLRACHAAPLRCGIALATVLGCLLSPPPARAGDAPSLKEVLGNVQSQAETKAVNDLIDKLRGVARKPPPAAPAPVPQAQDAQGSSVPPQAPPAPDLAEAPLASKPQQDRIASPTPPSPPPAAEQTPPESAIASAAEKRSPSVDLEVFFAYNSHAIGNEALTVLRTLGRALSDARLADDAFLIAGHTDAKGGSAFNLELSQRRAEAVRQFLIANFGIDARKLTAKGFGSTHLKDPAHPRAADNRRVQIVNLSKEEARSGIAR